MNSRSGKKVRWHVSTKQDGLVYRVNYEYHYPNSAIVKHREPRRFETQADAERFAQDQRRMEYLFRNPEPGPAARSRSQTKKARA